jgi:hypothetical protein
MLENETYPVFDAVGLEAIRLIFELVNKLNLGSQPLLLAGEQRFQEAYRRFWS